MKQITQKDLINLIKDKQENAIDSLKFVSQQLTTRERMFEKALKEEKNKAYIEAYEDLICYIKGVVIVPEHIEESKTLLDPLCNTCGKTEEECPFHRTGSAYEDCSGFEEQKPHEIRNDRFKEFKDDDGHMIYLDAKEIDAMDIFKGREGCIKLSINGDSILFAITKIDYNDLVEWWKYWKQN